MIGPGSDKNQPILLASQWENAFFCVLHYKIKQGGGSPNSSIKVNSVSSFQGGTTSISDGISCEGASLRGASKLTTDKARAMMGLIVLSALWTRIPFVFTPRQCNFCALPRNRLGRCRQAVCLQRWLKQLIVALAFSNELSGLRRWHPVG